VYHGCQFFKKSRWYLINFFIESRITIDQSSQTPAIPTPNWIPSVDSSPSASQHKGTIRIAQRFCIVVRNIILLLLVAVLCVGIFRIVEYWFHYQSGKRDDGQGSPRYPSDEENRRCGGRVIIVNNASVETPIPGCNSEMYEEMHFIGGNLTSETLAHILSDYYNIRFLKFVKFTILESGKDMVPKIRRSLVSLFISFTALSNVLAFFDDYTFSFPQLRNVTLVSTTVSAKDEGRIQKLFLTSFAPKHEKRLICQNAQDCHLLKKSSVLVGMFSISG